MSSDGSVDVEALCAQNYVTEVRHVEGIREDETRGAGALGAHRNSR